MHIAALISAVVLAAAAPPQERTLVLDDCKYATPAAAQAAWPAAEKNTPKIEIDPAKAMLLLPCNFASNTEWRVAWDRRGKWNLADARELLLDVEAPGRAAGMIIYLRSGDGWYAANLLAPATKTTVTLRRGQFRSEGRPAGWGSIETIRLCVLRDAPTDRTVLAGNIRAACRPASLAVYRNDAGVKAERYLRQYARMAADSLGRGGLDCDVLDDEAVAAGKLAGKKLAVLPLNPKPPAAAIEQIRKFVAGGGKLVVFRQLPRPLGELLGVRVGGEIEGDASQLSCIVYQAGPGRPKIAAVQRFGPSRKLIPAKGTKIVGYWADATGKASKLPAITLNANGFFADSALSRHGRLAKDQLLLEMVAQLWPEAWEKVSLRRQADLGKLAGLAGVAELSAGAKANAAGDTFRLAKVEQLLHTADQLAEKAAAAKGRNWAGSADLLGKAQDAYTRAFATSAASRSGEFRGVWCHKPDGVAGMSWDQAAAVLARAGFNALIVNMCWGGAAAYPSGVLPTVTETDQLATCLAAARKHGLAVHVWKVNWSLGGRTPQGFRAKMRAAGRMQQDHTGEPIDWLCPSSDENQTLERQAMLEIVRKYPVAGIHFDYIRYPGRHACYCPGCRKKFQDQLGAEVANWPADVRTGNLKEKYLQFRRDNITALVAAVSAEARKIRPGVLISAAVFPDWFSARDGIGQDWRLWVRRGWLDFVCPMQYTADASRFAEMTARARGWMEGEAALVTGIGATLGQSPDMTLQQILISRRQGAGGFVLFDYNSVLAAEYLPLLQLGATATRTTWKPPRTARD